MFKAVKLRKVRLREGLQELPCASIFRLNEDFLMAAVFSRLPYLSSEALSTLLLHGSGVRLGELKAAAFWPTWTLQSKDAGAVRVEPDLCVEFDGIDLIVEGKLGDDPGYQTSEQWAREWAAWHQAERPDREKQALLLAIGGLGATTAASETATKIGEAANRLLRADFLGVPAIRWVGLSWQELYDRLSSETLGDQLNSQLTQDLKEILRYFGLRRYEFLGDLSGLTSSSRISAIGIGSLEVMGRWHTATREPDWVESSRASRPISTSSIAFFAGGRL
jgi:hypothetical protein